MNFKSQNLPHPSVCLYCPVLALAKQYLTTLGTMTDKTPELNYIREGEGRRGKEEEYLSVAWLVIRTFLMAEMPTVKGAASELPIPFLFSFFFACKIYFYISDMKLII